MNRLDNFIPLFPHFQPSAHCIKSIAETTPLALWWGEPDALYFSLKYRLPQPNLAGCTGVFEGDGNLLQPTQQGEGPLPAQLVQVACRSRQDDLDTRVLTSPQHQSGTRSGNRLLLQRLCQPLCHCFIPFSLPLPTPERLFAT